MKAKLFKRIKKLQAFKDYVHERLDKMGVPENPEPEENEKSGCRIEGRLNYIERKMALITDELLKWDHPGADNS